VLVLVTVLSCACQSSRNKQSEVLSGLPPPLVEIPRPSLSSPVTALVKILALCGEHYSHQHIFRRELLLDKTQSPNSTITSTMRLSTTIATAQLLGLSSAQSSDEHVWSSVAWILHGERTPIWGLTPSPALTPIGAQQMFGQGSLLRSRYLQNIMDLDDEAGRAPIVGIERNAIDNTQLSIMTNTDEFMVTSAQAFAQGLYPPLLQVFSNSTGGMEGAMLPNGSIVNFPLGGYQYPSIRTFSILDHESIW